MQTFHDKDLFFSFVWLTKRVDSTYTMIISIVPTIATRRSTENGVKYVICF